MGFKEIWKRFSIDSNTTNHSNPMLRKLGFSGVFIVDLAINANFYSSIADSWIMPVAGLVLVFMKVWNWITAQDEKNKVRRRFHYGAWGCLSIMSIIAVLSFGMAVTSVTNNNINDAIGLQSLKQTALISQENGWIKERTELTNTIIQLNNNLSSYNADRADWNKSKAADQHSLELATTRANELDKLIASVGTTSGGKIEKQSALINAQLIFSQVFSNQGAPLAIKFFFFIFGIGIELTLALSSTGKVNNEIITTEINNTEIIKPKRSYIKKNKKIEDDTTKILESFIPPNQESKNLLSEPIINIPSEKVSDNIKKILEKSININSKEIIPELEVTNEEEQVRPVIQAEERYIRSLFNNGNNNYLKDKIEAATESKVSIPDALKIFEFLGSVNGPLGSKFIEFRTTTNKWYSNYTENMIIDLLHSDKIKIL
jgi:hypothetical protein